MRHFLRTAVVLAPLALAAATPAQLGAAELLDAELERLAARLSTDDIWAEHSSWDDPWIVRTDHYEVRTTASWAAGRALADGLERMLETYGQVLGVDRVPPARQKVWVFPDLAAYNAFGESHGDAHSSFYGSFYAASHPERPVAVLYDANPTMLGIVATHGAVHQWLAFAFPNQNAQTWVVEGPAAYFSMYWSYDWFVDELERIEGRWEYVNLRDLRNDNIGAYGEHTHSRIVELAMLFQYLLEHREETRTTKPDEEVQRAPFRDFLVGMLEGRTGLQFVAVAAALADTDALQADFQAFAFPK